MKCSMVVISYNMPREIPRTVLSLGPPHQRDVLAEDVEIIVVDNGSKRMFDAAECAKLAPNVRVLQQPNPTHSPAAAVNFGLREARGELVGVLVDGARIASPGLVAMALRAARLHERPVISTHGFHLGPDLQQRSVPRGYGQAQEDALLERLTTLALPRERVVLMPEGMTDATLVTRARALAELCLRENLRLSPRLHVWLWGAKRGV